MIATVVPTKVMAPDEKHSGDFARPAESEGYGKVQVEVHRLKILVGNAFNELKIAYEADHEGLHFDVIVQAWLHCRYISGLDNRYSKLIETLEELETQLEKAQGHDFLSKWRARKMNMHDLMDSGKIQGSKNIERAAKFMELVESKLKFNRANEDRASMGQTEEAGRRVSAMTSLVPKIKKIWIDPVWSKVIATAIVFIVSTTFFWLLKEEHSKPPSQQPLAQAQPPQTPDLPIHKLKESNILYADISGDANTIRFVPSNEETFSDISIDGDSGTHVVSVPAGVTVHAILSGDNNLIYKNRAITLNLVEDNGDGNKTINSK